MFGKVKYNELVYLWSWTYFNVFYWCAFYWFYSQIIRTIVKRRSWWLQKKAPITYQIIHTILRNRKIKLSDISVLFTSWKARINKQLIHRILCKRGIKWIFDESLNYLIRDMLSFYRMTEIFPYVFKKKNWGGGW